MSGDVHLGRQPIIDAERTVFGYELLHRDGPAGSTAFDDPDAATRTVIERALLQWGMERVVGDRFGFINASPGLILDGLHEAMPPEGIIFEIRESEPFGEQTIGAIRTARSAGHHFALDNVNRLGDLERSELLPLASIAKIELTTTHRAEIDRMIEIARFRSPGILVVAEKVESADDLNRCIEHGFDLFQGYHVSGPEVLRRPARPVGRAAAAALRRALAPAIDATAVSAVLRSEPTVAFRLLAAVNASAFGLDRRVTSLDQAAALLGVAEFARLAELLATSTDTVDDHTERRRGAVRACMAARLLDGTEQAAAGVTAALISVGDRIYATAMSELVDELPLSGEIIDALLGGRGRVGRSLDIIRACERDDGAELDDLAPGRAGEMCELYRSCLREIDESLGRDEPSLTATEGSVILGSA